MVGCDISNWKETLALPHLAGPPVLVGSVCYGDDVPSLEFQLSMFLWYEVVQRLH